MTTDQANELKLGIYLDRLDNNRIAKRLSIAEERKSYAETFYTWLFEKISREIDRRAQNEEAEIGFVKFIESSELTRPISDFNLISVAEANHEICKHTNVH